MFEKNKKLNICIRLYNRHVSEDTHKDSSTKDSILALHVDVIELQQNKI